MRRPDMRLALVTPALVLAAGLLLCSCQDDGPSGPIPDPDCIGTAGGTVAVTDTTDLLCGVSLGVAPETWQQCWSVYLFYRSTFSTPDFPAGLEGYEGWLTGGVDLAIGREAAAGWVEAPEPLEFELTFPVRDLVAGPGEKLVAFRYDDEAGRYRLALPLRQDATGLTVKAHHHRQLWTWGKVDLEEVDFDTYLAPVMEELHGAGDWLEIQAELDRLQAEALEGRRALTCLALTTTRNALLDVAGTAAVNVRSIQDALGGRCGVCDATSPEFYDELAEYLQLRAQQLITEFFLGNSRNVLIQIYGFIMCEYMEYCVAQLDCDYECFADAVTVEFYGQLARHYVCTVMAGLIDWYIAMGYVDCL
ncbi:MAG: hypothetical protein R6X35_15055 [Candidatus Krumholzibacteriia bacterium]